MKEEEKISKEYFQSIGYCNIIFEPNGNRTPDFLLDSRIAVEVRRLNQFYNYQPIEKVQFQSIPKIIDFIESFGNGRHQKSAFVCISFSRPIKIKKDTLNVIKSILDQHSNSMDVSMEYFISDNLRFEIIPSSKLLDKQFKLGAQIDEDHGGFVIANMVNSLEIILAEKEQKIKPFLHEYEHWWLALVDHIGYGLSQNEVNKLRDELKKESIFEKIFFISPVNSTIGCELQL